MQTTQPLDLLRSILDQAAARAGHVGGVVDVTATGPHPIVFQGCTFTIHQHISVPTPITPEDSTFA